jgi:hypothetical protein
MNCIPMVGRLALAGVASGLRRTIDLAASDVQPGREKTSPNRLGPAYSSSPADDGGAFFKNVKLTSNMARCFPPIPLPYPVTEFKPFYDALSALYQG